MVLTTHIIVAGAVSAPLIAAGHPALGLVAGLASHYLIDAIPHWSYRLSQIENSGDARKRRWGNDKRAVARDIGKTAVDSLIGTVILLCVILAFGKPAFLTLVAGWLGALPDGLQGIQLVYKKFPMPWLQKFHDLFHFDNGGTWDLPLTTKTFLSQALLFIVAIGTLAFSY